MKSRDIALHGILVTLALALSYMETQIPVFFAVPGMKLGLTNLVVLVSLYLIGEKSALLINMIRILLVGFLFGSGVSILYSMAGGVLSFIVMFLLKRTERFSVVAVSIAGGVAHNIGQILVAMAMLNTTSLAWYLLVLWFTGMASGAVIGVLGGILVNRLKGRINR